MTAGDILAAFSARFGHSTAALIVSIVHGSVVVNEIPNRAVAHDMAFFLSQQYGLIAQTIEPLQGWGLWTVVGLG